jgi:outer membrane protein insertion porin family
MLGLIRSCFASLLVFPFLAHPGAAQTPDTATAALREVHVDGMKLLTEAQIVDLSQLTLGTQVGRKELQTGADHLVQSGLFAKVSYNFQTRGDGVHLTFHVEESPRIPVYFDNVPWFTDAELGDAIRKTLPFFDGTLPEAGNVVEQAAGVLKDLLAARGMNVAVEHQVLASPLSDNSVQEFRIEGASLQISRIEFSDPDLLSSRVVQQHLSEIRGKAYSRMAIDLFLAEQIRPVYLQQGYLHAKLGPPEVRLTGNPNQKLPDQIPVYVPVTPGALYHWKGVEWKGNALLSSFTLTDLMRLKPGDVANGMTIEGGWERVSEEYAHRGYLDAKVDPVLSYDNEAHVVSYAVIIQEGVQYHYDTMLITGMSLAGERKIREAWTIKQGDIFDKAQFEQLLSKLQSHREEIFKDLPANYREVGHWLQTDAGKGTVEVLLDFK